MSSYSSGSSQVIGLEELKRKMDEMSSSSSESSQFMDVDESGNNEVEWSAPSDINQGGSATIETIQERSARAPEFNGRDKVENNEDVNKATSECDLDDLEKLIDEFLRCRRRCGKRDANQFSIADFDVGRKLGGGAFGEVFYARDKHMKFEVAIKKIKKTKVADDFKTNKQIFFEAYIHEKLKHPNIINFLTQFHDKSFVYFVLDYAENGTLRSYTNRFKLFRVPEQEVAKFTFQVADALFYLHKEGYIYGDLKPENILLDYNFNVKLADFGLAFPLREGLLVNGTLIYGGTPEYLAPELVWGSLYTFKVDLWCLGVFTFELLAGRSPFKSKKNRKSWQRIEDLDYTFPTFFVEDQKNFIRGLLQKDMESRSSLVEVLNNKWLLSHHKQRPHSIPSNETWPYSALKVKRLSKKPPELKNAWSLLSKETLENLRKGKDNCWYYPNDELPELEEDYSDTDEPLSEFENEPETNNLQGMDALQGQQNLTIDNNKPGCSHWKDGNNK